MLKLIEKEAGGIRKVEDKQMAEEERLVMEIKLGALEEEIVEVRNKIRQALTRKNLQ